MSLYITRINFKTSWDNENISIYRNRIFTWNDVNIIMCSTMQCWVYRHTIGKNIVLSYMYTQYIQIRTLTSTTRLYFGMSLFLDFTFIQSCSITNTSFLVVTSIDSQSLGIIFTTSHHDWGLGQTWKETSVDTSLRLYIDHPATK